MANSLLTYRLHRPMDFYQLMGVPPTGQRQKPAGDWLGFCIFLIGLGIVLWRLLIPQ